jgi:hypothetical protein
VKQNSGKVSVTLCIPIYKPPLDFFNRLACLVVPQELDVNLSLCETIESHILPANSQNLQILEGVFSTVDHYAITKDNFSHSRTRNEMVIRNQESNFLIFSTQDTFFPENFADLLLYSANRMEKQNLAGLCFRHESPIAEMNAVFDNIFKNLPYDSYLQGKTEDINWWSNNFAIYRSSVIKDYPFPSSVSWAEDLAWAKLVSMKGFRLAVASCYAIKHLNDDNLRSAYMRGLENGIGLIEVHNLIRRPYPNLTFKNDLFRAALGMCKIEILRSKRRKLNKIRLKGLIKTMLVWSAQAAGRIYVLKRIEKRGALHGIN